MKQVYLTNLVYTGRGGVGWGGKASEQFTITDNCWYTEGKVDSMSTMRYKITTELL